jgi:hypothetical protein
MFKLNHEAKSTGTSLKSEVMVAPARLVEVFGEPEEADGYKVSMLYTFEDEDGNVVTLYDWKATTLYDSGYGPHPTTFRKQELDHDFHIGGKDPAVAQRFRAWLMKKVKRG